MDILIQVIGAFGYSILAFSYFRKVKLDILLMQIIAYVFFTIHYYMLNGITGAICNVIGGVALIIIFLFEKFKLKNKNILIICMVPITIIISIITYQNIYSIFPIIASISVILSFISSDENVIRFVGLLSAICWLGYAIMYKSYVAIVFEVITLIFVVVATIKNYKKVNSDKK